MSEFVVPKSIDNDAIIRVQNVVNRIRTFIMSQQRRSHIQPELEIRLGIYGENKRFNSGVTSTAWGRLYCALESSNDWTEVVTDWGEQVDFFYNISHEGVQEQVRTSRYVEAGSLKSVHIVKSKMHQCIVDIRGIEDVAQCARVSFCVEKAVGVNALPSLTITDHVRIKHRRSYTWNNWRFDLTKVWSAKTLAMATRNRDNDENTMYEIEVECIDPQLYLSEENHTNAYVALSIILKILGLLPPDGVMIS